MSYATRCVLYVLLFSAFVIPGTTARASLIGGDFEISGFSASGIGHFELDGPNSGLGATVTAFSYQGQVFGHSYSLSLEDVHIQNFHLVLDELTGVYWIDQMYIVTDLVLSDDGKVRASLELPDAPGLGLADVVCESVNDDGECGGANWWGYNYDLSATYGDITNVVPVPVSVWLVVPALFGVFGYKRKFETAV